MSDHLHGKKQILVLAGFLFLSIFTPACLPTTPFPPLPTETPTPSATVSPTVIWFPPTETKTAIPTMAETPTPERQAGTGQVLLIENFNDIALWITGNPGNGTVALGIQEITLAITQPKGYLYSFRSEPNLTDFYAEITASPSLCIGADEYGMLFRYNSQVDFYRFSLSCDGRTRLDKLSGGTASSPQPWLDSISVPQAAPSSSQISVMVKGSEMSFFIDNELQFIITDKTLPSGLIGVFARSAGDNAVTVSFSDLVIYQTQP